MSASRRERPGSALMNAPAGRSLSLCESIHSCQGSILSASLAPRSWHERAFQHPDRASSSQGCLMSLSALFPSAWRDCVLSPLHVISMKYLYQEGSSHFLLPLDRGTSSVHGKTTHSDRFLQVSWTSLHKSKRSRRSARGREKNWFK